MFDAIFTASSGQSFSFGYKAGVLYSIDPIGDERGGEQGTGNNAQQIHTPIVRYLGLRGKPNGPAASKQQVESGVTHMV